MSKVIITTVFTLILAVGLVASVVAVRQNQDIREKAAGPPPGIENQLVGTPASDSLTIQPGKAEEKEITGKGLLRLFANSETSTSAPTPISTLIPTIAPTNQAPTGDPAPTEPQPTLLGTSVPGPTEVPLPDLNGDGTVNFLDLAAMISVYTQLNVTVDSTNIQFDLNNDNLINIEDFGLALSGFYSITQ